MGMFTALTSLLAICAARSGVFNNAEPWAFFTTFCAGHPMFMSIPLGLLLFGRRASFFPASAKKSGSLPKSCMIKGCSFSANSNIFMVFSELCPSALMLASSEKQMVFGSISLTIWRYAESV